MQEVDGILWQTCRLKKRNVQAALHLALPADQASGAVEQVARKLRDHM